MGSAMHLQWTGGVPDRKKLWNAKHLFVLKNESEKMNSDESERNERNLCAGANTSVVNDEEQNLNTWRLCSSTVSRRSENMPVCGRRLSCKVAKQTTKTVQQWSRGHNTPKHIHIKISCIIFVFLLANGVDARAHIYALAGCRAHCNVTSSLAWEEREREEWFSSQTCESAWLTVTVTVTAAAGGSRPTQHC